MKTEMYIAYWASVILSIINSKAEDIVFALIWLVLSIVFITIFFILPRE